MGTNSGEYEFERECTHPELLLDSGGTLIIVPHYLRWLGLIHDPDTVKDKTWVPFENADKFIQPFSWLPLLPSLSLFARRFNTTEQRRSILRASCPGPDGN